MKKYQKFVIHNDSLWGIESENSKDLYWLGYCDKIEDQSGKFKISYGYIPKKFEYHRLIKKSQLLGFGIDRRRKYNFIDGPK